MFQFCRLFTMYSTLSLVCRNKDRRIHVQRRSISRRISQTHHGFDFLVLSICIISWHYNINYKIKLHHIQECLKFLMYTILPGSFFSYRPSCCLVLSSFMLVSKNVMIFYSTIKGWKYKRTH